MVWAAPPALATCHQFTVSGSPNPVNEGQTVTVTVTRDGNVGPSNIDVSTIDETAKAGDDYTKLSKTVSFSTDLSQTASVPIASHNTPEGERTFRVHLSNPGGCTINTAYEVGSDVRVSIRANGITTTTTSTTAGSSTTARPSTTTTSAQSPTTAAPSTARSPTTAATTAPPKSGTTTPSSATTGATTGPVTPGGTTTAPSSSPGPQSSTPDTGQPSDGQNPSSTESTVAGEPDAGVAAAPTSSGDKGNDKLPAGVVAVGLLGVAFVSSTAMSTYLKSRGGPARLD
jgi:hypothetical protein